MGGEVRSNKECFIVRKQGYRREAFKNRYEKINCTGGRQGKNNSVGKFCLLSGCKNKETRKLLFFIMVRNDEVCVETRGEREP